MHSLSSLFSVQVLSSEEAPSRISTSRANGLLFDGSYLSHAATGAQQPHMHRSGDGGRGPIQTCRNPESFPYVSELSSISGHIKEHMSQKRECREPHSCHTCDHSKGGNHDTDYGIQQWKSDNGTRLANGHYETFNQEECERYSSSPYSHYPSSPMTTSLSFTFCERSKQRVF